MGVEAPHGSAPLKAIRDDRLLGIEDVMEITGMCQRVSSELMSETGAAFKLRNQKFVFESAFYDFLMAKTREGGA